MKEHSPDELETASDYLEFIIHMAEEDMRILDGWTEATFKRNVHIDSILIPTTLPHRVPHRPNNVLGHRRHRQALCHRFHPTQGGSRLASRPKEARRRHTCPPNYPPDAKANLRGQVSLH